MHPRNRHQDRYDFTQLARDLPALKPFVLRTPDGQPSIDFADPAAVRVLNRALMQSLYDINGWQFPAGYLCPPIPGRADYLHGLADLLAQENGGVIPRGGAICALDIGTGASCIYPLLGHVDYGWSFVGSEIDSAALASATAIIAANSRLGAAVELRLQPDPMLILDGVVQPGERYDLTLCNPPFHASATQAAQAGARKWQNLGRSGGPRSRPARNFGGHAHELWCRGGERAFVGQMIKESAELASSVYWFSSLIANGAHLAPLKQQLQKSRRAAGANRGHGAGTEAKPLSGLDFSGCRAARGVATATLGRCQRIDVARLRRATGHCEGEYRAGAAALPAATTPGVARNHIRARN